VHTRPQLSARTVPGLVEYFNNISFDEFFWTPISYGGRDSIIVIEMIAKFEEIGPIILKALQIRTALPAADSP
jgi:hypothetical protein